MNQGPSAPQGGAGNWSLGGWTITTRVSDNDWIRGFVNRVYDTGRLQNMIGAIWNGIGVHQ